MMTEDFAHLVARAGMGAPGLAVMLNEPYELARRWCAGEEAAPLHVRVIVLLVIRGVVSEADVAAMAREPLRPAA